MEYGRVSFVVHALNRDLYFEWVAQELSFDLQHGLQKVNLWNGIACVDR